MGTEFPPEHVADPAAASELARATESSAPVLVVSGGISLGAYQAGFISTLVRFWSVARRDGGAGLGDPTPRVWTGASAGAVNALLGGLASCDPAFEQPQWSPEESLFWTVWVKQLDLEMLLPQDDPDRSNHLFSAPHMELTLAEIEKEAKTKRFRPDCSFAFGLTVTNLRGRDVPFGWGGPDSKAELTRVTEKLVVQVMTRGDGTLTARLPFTKGASSATAPYLALEQEARVHYPALGAPPSDEEGGQPVSLKNLLLTPQASGAFPLAFPPVEVDVSFFDEVQWGPKQSLKLVDGGFLNNNPLDLAVRLGARWVDEGGAGFNRSRFPVVYLDQDVVDWTWKPRDAPREGSLSPLEETYFQHVGNLMTAARDSVVLDTLEHDANLSGRIKIPRRGTVLPSEYQFAMMGFFDRRFRQHDFYRGMQDAIRFLSTQLTSTRAVESLVPRVPGQMLDRREQDIRDVLGISSGGFRCVVDGACEDVADGVELGKLRDATDALTRTAKAKKLKHGDVDDLLEALGEVGYEYGEGVMGVAKATGTRSDLLPVRVRVGTAFHDLVSHQKSGLRIALRPAGAAFLDDWLTYTPPRHAFTVHASRQRGVGVGWEKPLSSTAYEERREGGVSDRSELRLGVAVSAFGVRDMDRLVPNETRLRLVTLGTYADFVSDMDGFGGRVKGLQGGPYVRLRAGLGASGSYLRNPEEFSFLVPEARLGVDVAELVGLRLSVPLYLVKKSEDGWHHGTPKIFKETGLGVEVLITRW
ncbi:patatin-like phospholipase family protein [Myxococcus sp. RHSTA-1-4]|uniref:patatin-like phospholipase family protein n=1 Tax=Myxococcus sp. RHSTA-1-4 TaxID=2874601 RepID=UPI001CBB7657|nr:patatin-like phospholipase family protein [Myxococcus sp. RHSTA-1-4]